MALTERLALLVTLDANSAIKGFESVGKAADRNLGKAESKLDRVGTKMQKAGAGMLAGAGLAAAGLFKAGQSAADLEQAVGGTEAVFKDASGTIDKFAKDSARSMGLSERAFREATTSIGGQLKGLGFREDEAAEKSIELTGIASDLAATFGGTTADAVAALGSAFRGEADPAERFNLRLNQTTVNAKAVEMGLAASTSEVSAQAKAQATLALITEQSADAQGQFAREAGSASGAMQIANAEFENAKAALGESVAPIMAEVAGSLGGLASGFQKANSASGGLLSKLAAYGTIGLGAAGGLSLVVGKVITMRDNLSKLTGPLKNSSGGLNRLGTAVTTLGFAAGVAGLAALANSLNETTFDMDEFTRSVQGGSEATKEKARQDVLLAEEAGVLDEVVRRAAGADVIAAEALIDHADAAGVSADRIAELRAITDAKRESDVIGTQNQRKYSDEVDNAADSVGALTEKVEEQTVALDDLLEATLAQFDSNIAYRRSVDDVEDSLSELAATQKEHGSNSEEYRDKLLDTEAALLGQADAAVRNAEDVAKAAGGTLDAKRKTEIYRAELVKLRDSLAPGSSLRTALDMYIGALDSVPASITSEFKLKFPASLDNRFARYAPKANANGTSYFGGGMTWVGERGPELVNLPRGSQVHTAAASAQMAGGTTNVTIPVYIGDRLIDTIVVEGLDRYVKVNGTPRVLQSG